MGTMRNQWDPVLGRRAIQVDQQRARRPCPRCWRLRLSSPDFPGLPTFPHPRLLQTPGTPASAELSRARVQLIYLRRTAYVRVYVAVCLAVFFLSPHFSKREGPRRYGQWPHVLYVGGKTRKGSLLPCPFTSSLLSTACIQLNASSLSSPSSSSFPPTSCPTTTRERLCCRRRHGHEHEHKDTC